MTRASRQVQACAKRVVSHTHTHTHTHTLTHTLTHSRTHTHTLTHSLLCFDANARICTCTTRTASESAAEPTAAVRVTVHSRSISSRRSSRQVGAAECSHQRAFRDARAETNGACSPQREAHVPVCAAGARTQACEYLGKRAGLGRLNVHKHAIALRLLAPSRSPCWPYICLCVCCHFFPERGGIAACQQAAACSSLG